LKKQDKAIMIDVLLEADKILEEEWKKLGNWKEKLSEAKRIAEIRFWFVVGFCLGFRGEEMLLIEEAGTRRSLRNLSAPLEYFSVCITTGRTKGQQVLGSKFEIPCVGKTGGTGLRPVLWTKRLVDVRRKMKTTGGTRMFASSEIG
jgi:hypothetical protein